MTLPEPGKVRGFVLVQIEGGVPNRVSSFELEVLASRPFTDAEATDYPPSAVGIVTIPSGAVASALREAADRIESDGSMPPLSERTPHA